ncbi:hypothetical protein PENTCL1PPCAC_30201, partial [Pristionchus entomophagus]
LCLLTTLGQKDKFDRKVTAFVTSYFEENEPKVTSLVIDFLVAHLAWDEITDGLKKHVNSLIPVSKYISAAALISSFSSCLENAEGTMTETVTDITAAFKKVLKTPYNKIVKKMKTMPEAGKTAKQMRKQAYIVANAALTKRLVQKMINAAKAVSTEASWMCTTDSLNAVMIHL